jgi:hypothetical protein
MLFKIIILITIVYVHYICACSKRGGRGRSIFGKPKKGGGGSRNHQTTTTPAPGAMTPIPTGPPG